MDDSLPGDPRILGMCPGRHRAMSGTNWIFQSRKIISPGTPLAHQPSRDAGGEKRQLCLRNQIPDTHRTPKSRLEMSSEGMRFGLKVNQVSQLQVRGKNIQIPLCRWLGLFILNSPGQRKIPSSLPHLKPSRARNSFLASATLTQSH